MGGLNLDIQDILAYKDYDSVTRLFHLACKGEREVQGRRGSTRTNIPAGRTSSWTHATTGCQSNRAAALSSSISKPRLSTSNSTPSPSEPTRGTTAAPTKSSSSVDVKVHPRLHQRDEHEIFSAFTARATATCARPLPFGCGRLYLLVPIEESCMQSLHWALFLSTFTFINTLL